MATSWSGMAGRWFPVAGDHDLPNAVRTRGAFLPDPLPSEVVLEPSTQRHLGDAQEMLGRLDSGFMLLPNRADLTSFSQRLEVRYSAALDGVFTSSREASALDLPGAATPQVDERLAPYLTANDRAVAAARTGRPLDPALLGRLSRIQTGRPPEGPAPWRTDPAWLGGTRPQDAFLVTAPPGPELRVAVEQWCAWVDAQCDMQLIAKLAMGYLELTMLAPFPGSGHLSRLFFTYELMRSRVLHEPVLPVSAWLRQHSARQDALVRDLVKGAPLDAWMVFVAEWITATCRQQLVRIAEINEIHQQMLDTVTRKTAIVRLVDALIANPVMNLNKIAEICDVRPHHGASLARRLQEAGLAEIMDVKTEEQDFSGRSRNRVVIAPRIARLLGLVPPRSPADPPGREAGPPRQRGRRAVP